jgi:anti-anti-sigma factor
MEWNLFGRYPEEGGDGRILVHFTGRDVSLDEGAVHHARDQLAAIAEEPGGDRLLLDFGNVRYVSSAALDALVDLHRRLLGAGRRLALCNLRPRVYEVFAVTRLDRVFSVTAEGPGPAPPSPGGADDEPGAVLVVDDDPAVLAVLGAGLRRGGFVVWPASGGRQAVELCRGDPGAIAVALLDVRMPGMDGPHTLRALREVCPSVRACFMTGDPEPYTEEGLLRLDALRVFRKPVALAEVAGTLRHLAARPARRWQERWVEMPFGSSQAGGGVRP